MMFDVTMLPASEGDCLLIRYGPEDAPHRVLIDAGRAATVQALLDFLPPSERHLELFVVSHVDRDHIEGALKIIGDKTAGFTFDDIWFNAYRHLDWRPGVEDFGAVQGEKLTTAITDRRLPWNHAFGGGPARLEAGAPVVRTLLGGLTLTLLSPGKAQLLALQPQWEEECRKAGLDPSKAVPAVDAPAEDASWTSGYEGFGGSLEEIADQKTKEDTAAPNGSSIAFLAEYEGRSVLFGADAHPSVLVESLKALGRPLPISCALVKAPHHGSQANTTRALLDLVSCDRFFISTNGSYFDHPDEVAIARILTSASPGPKTLFFNYRQDHTRPWAESASQMKKYRYGCVFPDGDRAPVTLALSTA